jgi:DNA-binding GntR family transcriptional regulator
MSCLRSAASQELGASYIPASIAGGTYLEQPTVVPKALFLCVEDLSGRHYTRASDRWQVRPATAEESGLLEVPAGSPVIHLIHNAADENGDTLEVSESIWPSDRIVVIDDYDIAQEPEKQEGMSDV